MRRHPPLLTWRLLGAALVAELAVWALLDLIRHQVGIRLDAQVQRVWIAGRKVVQNTQALRSLAVTRRRTADLVEELERHQSTEGRPWTSA